MSEIIQNLVEEVCEACSDSRYRRLKSMWTRHNRLEKVEKVPVSVHLHRGHTQTWKELIPPEQIESQDPLERDVELQLRQKLFRYRHIPDDDVLLPTIWLDPVRPAQAGPLWGVELERVRPDDPRGAYTFRPIVRQEADLARLHFPEYDVDDKTTAILVERARELVDDALPVKLWTDEVGQSPGELLPQFLGWEGFLYALTEHPNLVHKLMDFLTRGIIHYQCDREAKGAVDAESSWWYRVHYEELPPDEPANRLSSCWAYIAAQPTGIISPAMYTEFVHPYNERIVGLFGRERVYYHGCEDLTAKIDIISTLPGLRRFDVSAWTDLPTAVDKLGQRVVLEVQVHPGDTILTGNSDDMRRAIERIMAVAGDCIIDINLSDVETVNGNPAILTTWATIAQDVVTRG